MTHDMLYDVLSFLEHAEETHPVGAHPKCFSMWRATVEAEFQAQIVSHIESQQHLKAVLDIFRGCVEYRAATHARAWADSMRIPSALAPPFNTNPPLPWDHLLTVTQIAQRTPEWYEEGRRLLTASEFWKLLDTPRTFSNLIVSKLPLPADAAPRPAQRLACAYADMNAMDWGTCLEPVVKYYLKEQKGWSITDLGRIRHPRGDLPLAASPDGLITDGPSADIGNLIEIKCPRTRPLEASAVPFEYWCQMQIQMECTGRPACEYVEMKFDLAPIPPEMVEPTLESECASCIMLVRNSETCEMRYVYGFDPAFSSIRQKLLQDENSNEYSVEYTRWSPVALRHVQILRDTEWFCSVLPLIQQFAETLEGALKGTWKPMPPLERKKRVSESVVQQCAIQDSPPASPRAVHPIRAIEDVEGTVPVLAIEPSVATGVETL